MNSVTLARPVATRVEVLADPAQLPHIFGRQLIQVQDAICYPEICAGDVLDVDFDARMIGADGLYLFATDDPAAPPAWGRAWYGARRVQRKPGEGLLVQEGERWMPFSPAAGYMVCGRVMDVYKPSRRCAP